MIFGECLPFIVWATAWPSVPDARSGCSRVHATNPVNGSDNESEAMRIG